MSADWLTGAPMDPLAVPPEPLPPLAGFPFLHEATAAVVSGPTGGGRSALVQACSYDAARAGLRVAYLGSEVTEAEFNARAGDLARRRGDLVDAELQALLANVRYLDLASVLVAAWDDPAVWVQGVVGLFDVVLMDPLSSVASTLGFDFDNSNAEFVRFYDRIVQPIVGAGVTVVMLDNVGHAFDAKSRPKGVSAKLDRVDLAFSCKRRAQPEALIVKAEKVRSVRAPFTREAQWVFSRDSQRVERIVDSDPSKPFRPTTLMQRASVAIEDRSGIGTNRLRQQIKPARKEHIDLAVDRLIEEGYIRQEPDGQNLRHFSVRPYRIEDDPDAVEDASLLDRAAELEDRYAEPVAPTLYGQAS